MKTDTKQRLLILIKEQGSMRPVDLARLLKISPQALHRQLKGLVSAGTLVAVGRPPYTQYAIAGVPEFTAAFAWLAARTLEHSPTDRVCETRDAFVGRLSPLRTLTRQGLASDDLSLFVSLVGEIGNNSFDHNLGQWRDVPGCWFETQVTGSKLWVCIGDRGQGIYNSLIKVVPTIQDDSAALKTAFEEFVSGRSPEKRGNGLKYVKRTVVGASRRGIACVSGNACRHYGDWGSDCADVAQQVMPAINGTLTLLAWGLG